MTHLAIVARRLPLDIHAGRFEPLGPPRRAVFRCAGIPCEICGVPLNPCEGIKQLYSGDRSEIIWLDADIEHLKKTCSVEIAHAVDLAAHTGLRLSDLLRLSWSHVQEAEDTIILPTGKSRGKKEAVIPLYDALRAVLKRIPKRSTTILTSSKKRPWTADGFGSSFNKAKIDARMNDRPRSALS